MWKSRPTPPCLKVIYILNCGLFNFRRWPFPPFWTFSTILWYFLFGILPLDFCFFCQTPDLDKDLKSRSWLCFTPVTRTTRTTPHQNLQEGFKVQVWNLAQLTKIRLSDSCQVNNCPCDFYPWDNCTLLLQNFRCSEFESKKIKVLRNIGSQKIWVQKNPVQKEF